MKKEARWLLVDTETTGLTQPIHAVEIAAQIMEGWKPVGEPFRQLINVDAEIPSEVSRVQSMMQLRLPVSSCMRLHPEDGSVV